MRKASLLAAPLLLCATPAVAELPEAARAMIDAAIASGDAEAVAAVIAAARTAFPDDGAEIDAIWEGFQAQQAQLATAQAAAAQQALRTAGPFDNWSGQGQIGAFQSSGNSDEIGLTGSLQLTREGIAWEHKLRLSADYRRNNGVTSREQFLARYEPRYQINEGLFAYGLTQFEHDRLQGYSGRYVASGGLGYKVVDTDALDLAVKAGPAYRVTDFVNGGSSSRVAGLLGLDFDWRLSDSIKLTQDANTTAETGGEALLVVDSANTSLSVITGLEAGLGAALTARVSYAVEYDSNPPPGGVNTDTLTRFTLIYGF